MKYSMVKQFYNGALDNMYSFFFKWVDFGKLMIEVFWAFLEIWQAFFMIFWNFIMYIYYFFLFLIDRGAESSQPGMLLRRPAATRRSSAPKVQVSRAPNPVPASYGVTSKVAETTRSISAAVTEPARNVSSANYGKKSIFRSILEFFESIAGALKKIIVAPAQAFGNFFADKIKPVREEGSHAAEPQKRSLIDEYIREYEEKRNA